MIDVLQHALEERMHQELLHLTAEDRCALIRLIERLVEAYQPNRIYLFGSKARSDYGPDSDFDLMVVQQTTGYCWRTLSLYLSAP
jgi:predicted nucleotidyltransferase